MDFLLCIDRNAKKNENEPRTERQTEQSNWWKTKREKLKTTCDGYTSYTDTVTRYSPWSVRFLVSVSVCEGGKMKRNTTKEITSVSPQSQTNGPSKRTKEWIATEKHTIVVDVFMKCRWTFSDSIFCTVLPQQQPTKNNKTRNLRIFLCSAVMFFLFFCWILSLNSLGANNNNHKKWKINSIKLTLETHENFRANLLFYGFLSSNQNDI